MKTVKMLPHGCKLVGLSLLALSLLLFALCFNAIINPFTTAGAVPQHFGQGWIHLLFAFLFSLGVALTALSREKVEDERIAEMRHSSIIWAVILFVVLSALIMSPVLRIIIDRLFYSPDLKTVDFARVSETMIILRSLISASALIFYYLVIFNISLLVDKKRMNNEE